MKKISRILKTIELGTKVSAEGVTGAVKFSGPIEVEPGVIEDMVGILLDEEHTGNSNGKYLGLQLFKVSLKKILLFLFPLQFFLESKKDYFLSVFLHMYD